MSSHTIFPQTWCLMPQYHSHPTTITPLDTIPQNLSHPIVPRKYYNTFSKLLFPEAQYHKYLVYTTVPWEWDITPIIFPFHTMQQSFPHYSLWDTIPQHISKTDLLRHNPTIFFQYYNSLSHNITLFSPHSFAETPNHSIFPNLSSPETQYPNIFPTLYLPDTQCQHFYHTPETYCHNIFPTQYFREKQNCNIFSWDTMHVTFPILRFPYIQCHNLS